MNPRNTYRQNHIEKGLCIYCPRKPLFGKMCQLCRVTRSKIQSRFRQRQKAKGKCTRCPKYINNEKYKTCFDCRKSRAAYMKRKRNGTESR